MANESDIQALIAERQSDFSLECISLASISFYVFDYFITFEGEVTYIWGGNWTLGKLLFILLRYGTFADIIVGKSYDIVSSTGGGIGEKEHGPWTISFNLFSLVLPYVQLGILLLCIYGLMGATKVWRIACIAAYIVMFSISCSLMTGHLVTQDNTVKGDVNSSFRVAGNYWVFFRYLAVAALGVTALYTRYRDSQCSVDRKTSLITVLRRDGLFCYCGTLVTVLWACIVYTPGFPQSIRTRAYSGVLARRLDAVLATRLILNLRRNAMGHGADIGSVSTDIRFARNDHEAVHMRSEADWTTSRTTPSRN